MSKLGRRLRKLEVKLTDGSGFVPNSQRWHEYWKKRIPQILDGELNEKIPIDAVRAWMGSCDDATG